MSLWMKSFSGLDYVHNSHCTLFIMKHRAVLTFESVNGTQAYVYSVFILIKATAQLRPCLIMMLLKMVLTFWSANNTVKRQILDLFLIALFIARFFAL